jgi:uncharacterized membrane protein YphA (DoxX/SURF4 family)
VKKIINAGLRRNIDGILSSLLVALFVYAGLSKMLDYANFKLQLGKSPFIAGFAPVLAWAIPTIELIVAILLLIPATKLIGLYGSLFLLSLFSSYIYAMLHYSYYLPCNCGGVLSKMSWGQHLIFNLVFVVLCLGGIYFQNKTDLYEKATG